MNVLEFSPGHLPRLAVHPDTQPDNGFYWVDTVRSEPDWHEQIIRWLGCPLHHNHLRDCANQLHPPFYDGTDDYDLLVFRAAVASENVDSLATQPVVFIVSPQAVISVRPPDTPYFDKLHKRLLASPKKAPSSPLELLYLLTNQLIEGLLERRNSVTELLSTWQDRLLDRNDVFDNWQSLMKLRGQLRRLEVVSESQMDALADFREQTSLEITPSLVVHYNDLTEHLKRVYNHSVVIQHDIDAMVQIFFSANTQKTNDILRFLAVVSAIFLPLNLLAGIFGMNFSHLPLLQSPAAPWLLLGIMVVVAGGLVVWLRGRKWI